MKKAVESSLKCSLLIFGLFFVFLSLSLISASSLCVTNEHPFLINNEWIPASQLQVGNFLTTVDGKKVRITGIEDIVSDNNFLVYNLEAGVYHDVRNVLGNSGISEHPENLTSVSESFHDFVVNGNNSSSGIVVHNSDATINGRSTIDISAFPKSPLEEILNEKTIAPPIPVTSERIIEASQLSDMDIILRDYGIKSNLYNSYDVAKAELDTWAMTNMGKGVTMATGGSFKDKVYLTDGTSLPAFLEGKISKGVPLAIKKLSDNYVSNLDLSNANLKAEVMCELRLNSVAERRGMDDIMPRTFGVQQSSPKLVQSETIYGDQYETRGIIVQERIKEQSLNNFDYRLEHDTSPRAKELLARRDVEFKRLQNSFGSIFKEAGVRFSDSHGNNIAVGLKIAGKKVNVDEVLNSYVSINDVEFYLRMYECGGSVLGPAGSGRISF